MNNKLSLLAVVLCISGLAFWLGQQFNAKQTQQIKPDGSVTIHRSNSAEAQGLNAEQNPQAPAKLSSSTPQTAVEPAKQSTSTTDALPPDDTPLAESFETLKQQALAGNRRATCRLAKELLHCKNQAGNKRAHEMLLSVASGEQGRGIPTIDARNAEEGANKSDPMIDILAYTEEHIERSKKLCQHITPEQVAQTYAMQQLGVQQGITPIQADYLMNPALPNQRYLDDLSGWQDYQRRAPEVAETLMRQGNPDAIGWLAQAYADQPSIANQVPFSLNNPTLAATYALLNQRLKPNLHPGHPMHTPVNPQLTAEQRQQAEQDAERLAQTYFANHTPPDANQTTPNLPPYQSPASECQSINP